MLEIITATLEVHRHPCFSQRHAFRIDIYNILLALLCMYYPRASRLQPPCPAKCVKPKVFYKSVSDWLKMSGVSLLAKNRLIINAQIEILARCETANTLCFCRAKWHIFATNGV